MGREKTLETKPFNPSRARPCVLYIVSDVTAMGRLVLVTWAGRQFERCTTNRMIDITVEQAWRIPGQPPRLLKGKARKADTDS